MTGVFKSMPKKLVDKSGEPIFDNAFGTICA